MLHRLSVPSLTLSMKQYDDSLVRVQYLLQVPAVSALMVIVLMQAEFQHAQRHAAAKQIQGAITLRASPCVHHPACIALRAPSLAPRSGVVTARLSRSAATTMRREKEAEAATQINGLVRSRDIAKVGGVGDTSGMYSWAPQHIASPRPGNLELCMSCPEQRPHGSGTVGVKQQH